MKRSNEMIDEINITLSAPIQPHELDKPMRHGMEDLVSRISARAVLEGRGQDLLLRIYMAGMYHATELLSPSQ